MVVPKTLVRKLFPHVLGTLGLKCIIRFLFVLANNYAAKIRKSANNPKQNGYFVFVLSREDRCKARFLFKNQSNPTKRMD